MGHGASSSGAVRVCLSFVVLLVAVLLLATASRGLARHERAVPTPLLRTEIWDLDLDADGDGVIDTEEWALIEEGFDAESAEAERRYDDTILKGRKTAQEVMEDAVNGRGKGRQKREEDKVEEPKEAVAALTSETLDEALAKYRFVVIEFIAPWCGHCRKLAPEFEAAARELSHKPDVLLAKVDCTQNEDLARQYDVRGYPTIKFFRDGKYIMEYELGRTAEDLVTFMLKKSSPPTSVLRSVDEVKSFKAAHPNCLIVYASPKSDALLSVKDAANNPAVEDFVFGEVSDADVISKLGEVVNTAKIYRSFADEYTLTDPTPNSVLDSVLAHGYPYVDNGPDAWNRILARKRPVAILFDNIDADGDKGSTLPWFTDIAKSQIEKFAFLYAGKEFHSRLSTLGASGDRIPTVVVVDPETTKSWPFDETKELDRENVEAFLQGISEGTLRAHYASQKPPATNEGPVLTVVGDTFEELVLNNDKSVIVEFYAPWCGHCKQLAPTWEKLGEHYRGGDNLIVAQIDASANDNPAVVVQGYPSIFFFPAGDKAHPVEYKGLTRNFQDFIAFIEQNMPKSIASKKIDHDHEDL